MVDGLPGEIMARVTSILVRKLELEHALALRHQEEELAVLVTLLNQQHAKVRDDEIMVN